MKFTISILGSLAVFLAASASSYAAEPAYCDVRTFLSKEVRYPSRDLENHHLYKLGSVHLLGVGVGESEIDSVIRAATQLGRVTRTQNYCTWYINDENEEAAEIFNWFPVERPDDDIRWSVSHYRQVLQGVFEKNSINMLDCLTTNHYVALGCNGMKHRGPTLFGMLLAYSGCSPARAAAIVNTVWGLNGVPERSRLAIITDAYNMGTANPVARQELQKLFTQP
jgi:hypothetical protein